MGLVGRLFGMGLVVAGLFIAVYWTMWTLMIVVSNLCPNGKLIQLDSILKIIYSLR